MKIYKIASAQIGPVYHGTVYDFNPNELKMINNAIFFSESAKFANDYGHQKSQEGKMDADIKVIEAYISGNVFDPQNEQNVNAIIPFLETSGDKIRVYNNFGMGANLKIDKWKSLVSGVYVEPPEYTDEELMGKKIGDYLPDKEVMDDKRPAYEILEITNDFVQCARIGTTNSILNGEYSYRWLKDEIPKVSKEELANDMINMDRISFMKKYKDVNRHRSFYLPKFSRKEKVTHNNDVWRWLEGDGVFEAIEKAGFNIVKSREKGQITYVVLPGAAIINARHVKI